MKMSSEDFIQKVETAWSAFKRGPSRADLRSAPVITCWLPARQGYCCFVYGHIRRHPTFKDNWMRTGLLVGLSDDLTWACSMDRFYRLSRTASTAVEIEALVAQMTKLGLASIGFGEMQPVIRGSNDVIATAINNDRRRSA